MPRGRGLGDLLLEDGAGAKLSPVSYLDQDGIDAYQLSLEYDLGSLDDLWSLLKRFDSTSKMNGFRAAIWSGGDEWEKDLLVQFLIDDLPKEAKKDLWQKDLGWLKESGHWQSFSEKQQKRMEQDASSANYIVALLRAQEKLQDGLARSETKEALEKCLAAMEKGEVANLDVYPLELALAECYSGEHQELFEEKCQEADELLRAEGIESGEPARYLLHPSIVALAANCAGIEPADSVNLSHGRYTHKSHSIIVADEERTLLDQTVCHETLHAAQSLGDDDPSDISHPELGERYEKAAQLILEGVTSTFAGTLTGKVDGISQEYVIAGLAALDLVEEKPGLDVADIAAVHPRKMITTIGEHIFPGESDKEEKVIERFFDNCQRYNMDARISLSCSPSSQKS